MGKVWRPRRRPAEAPLEVDGVKDRPQGVGVGVAVPVGKIMRQPQPRRPAKAPLKSVGVKEDAKRVVASSVGAGVAGSLEEDGTAAVVCLMEEDSLDDRTAVGKVWRPRPQPQRPAKAPLNAVGVKYAQGAVAMASSMLEAPVVAAARGHWDKGPLLEDHGTAAVCRMDSLDVAPAVIAMTQRHKSVGAVLKKDTKEVALGKVWRPRKPAKKAPLKAVGVKDTKGVDVIGVDDGEVIKASGLGASMVAAEKWPLEDGIAMCRIDTLGGATRQKAAVGLMKDARGGVVVGKMWQPRRPPVKAPLKAVGVEVDTKEVAMITVDRVVKASVLEAPVVAPASGGEKGSLEDGTVVCQMDSLDGALVIATTRQEAVGVKNTQGVAMGKMWRPRRPAKDLVHVVGVKDDEGVVVTDVDRKVEASVLLGAPMLMGREKVPLEEGIALCRVDALDGAPVISTTLKEEVEVNNTEGGAVGKRRRPRRSSKKPLEALGVKDAEGVAVITLVGEVEPLVLGVPMVAEVGDREKGPLEDGIVVCPVDALNGAPVIATDEKEEVSVQGDPVVQAAGGREKGSLEDGIVVCRVDALDQAPVISTTREEEVGVKSDEGVVVGKRRRPRRSVKKPLEALGVNDAEGVAVNTFTGEVEPLVLGVLVVTEVGGREKGQLEDGIVVCPVDALNVAPVMATDEKEEVWVQGDPVVAEARGGEKGSLEDGIVVCRVDALDRAPVISTTREEEVGVKSDEGVVVGKRRRRRRSVKKPLEALGVNDAEGVAVNTLTGEVEPLVLGVLVVTEVGGREKGQLEDGIVVCPVDALNAAPVMATDEKEEVWVQGDPVVAEARGGEKGSLEDGIVVCRVDALDRAPIISTTREEEVGVKSDEGVVVGKRRRRRRSVKKPLEALGVNDAEGVAVNTLTGEVEPLVLGVLVVTEVGGREKGQLEDGIVVCPVDALNAAPVMATDEKEEVWVQGDPVVAEARGGEKGSLEDGIVVCRVDTLKGDPFIATDEKEEVSVQGNPVFPTFDQKVDAPVLERIQTITVKGNGKEDKDKEGIKWLKHYSTAQSILIIGDGDFSFSLALATAFGSGGNLVATSLDSYKALTRKYGKAESNVRELKRLGATVLHGVDAETMKLHPYLEMRRFDRIVFNFPHAGFKGKEYQLHVISSHKQLVRGFLANARQLLRPCGEIHLSHKKGFPYDAWGIKKLACESCLIMVRKVDFSKEDYPGYNQKRGDGVTCDDSFPLGPCWTFMFRAGEAEKLKKAHGNRVGLISSCLGDPGKCYPPGMSAASMMWPFDLHPTWPQPHFPPVHMPIAFDPCPFGVAGLEDPFNCYGTSFHHQHIVQPTHQEKPWYQEGPPIETPWTPQEHQSLQREYEIHRQLTRSLEDRYMESVERQATLEMLIQVYGRH